MREVGFYWVQHDAGIFQPAFWNGDYWQLVGTTLHFNNYNFLSIEEQIIKQ